MTELKYTCMFIYKQLDSDNQTKNSTLPLIIECLWTKFENQMMYGKIFEVSCHKRNDGGAHYYHDKCSVCKMYNFQRLKNLTTSAVN